MKAHKIFSVILLLTISVQLTGQVQDSSVVADSLSFEQQVDSLEQIEKAIKKPYPVPKKAALFAIIPGGGQVYNKRWWKLPLVYGAFGGLIYSIDFNQSRYRRLRDALELKRMNMDHEFTGTGIDSEQALLSLRDEYDKNTQLSYIGLVFVYLLQSMEAHVDAHLKNFDVSDDLSLQLKPQLEMIPAIGQPVLGVGLSVDLGQQRQAPVVPRDFLSGE